MEHSLASTSETPVEPLKNNLLGAAILTVAAARLLLDAYESVRRSPASVGYRQYAALAAAVLYVSPIREIGTSALTKSTKLINERCAMAAVASLMRISLANIDGTVLLREDSEFPKSGYLRDLIEKFERQAVDDATVLNINSLPTYVSYNANNDICWADVHEMEYIMNVLMLLDTAKAKEDHPKEQSIVHVRDVIR